MEEESNKTQAPEQIDYLSMPFSEEAYKNLKDAYQAMKKRLEDSQKHNAILQEEIDRLKLQMCQEESLVHDMTHHLEHVSSSVEHLTKLFVDTDAKKASHEKKPISAAFLQSLELQNDKELLFGINIKQEFLRQSSVNTIKYYLFACECRVKEEFEVKNLRIETKDQLALVGEAFAQYVRLTSLSDGESLQGIVEVLSGTIIDPPVLKYYGDKSIRCYFEEFVAIYSQQTKEEKE